MSGEERVQEGKSDAKRGKKGKGKVTWQGFLTCDLSSSDKDAIAAYVESGELSVDELFDFVGNGYKFGVSFSDTSGAFVATLMDVDPGSEFAGWMVSGWGDTARKATFALLYKHRVKWKAGWRFGAGGKGGSEYG